MSCLCAAAWRQELENRGIGTVEEEEMNDSELSEKNGGWLASLEGWRGRDDSE